MKLRILYAAIDQSVPGTSGGSVHVQAVAEGLAARGHVVEVLASPGNAPFPEGSASWLPLAPPFGARQLRWTRARQIEALALRFRPDAIIERYYNFGGEGLRAARRLGIAAVLEVNAPLIDYTGSPKQRLDRSLLVEPMRRWREWQCRAADLIVTPSTAILPDSVPSDRVVQLEWGADTERFHPGACGVVSFDRRPGRIIAVFAGAFRRWHGAIHFVTALRKIRERGGSSIDGVLVGSGPELAEVRAAARGIDGIGFTGAIPHEHMPACLAAAHIGVAPYDVTAHPPLAIDFYWSPLKVFEYMASGLPVVAPSIPRLSRLVRHEREGVLYDAASPDGLADALARLADEDLRTRLGRAARERVAAEFSWARHCELLEAAISAAVERRTAQASCER